MRLALVFVAAAAVAAVLADGRWLPLHLFLAGGLVLAISGASVMLTVTWSAAPAPPDRVVGIQRACVAIGVVGVGAWHQLELGSLVLGTSAALYLAGLGVLAAVLVVTVRRGVERRFDAAVAAYLVAIAAGTGGVVLGATMAIGAPTAHLRAAHLTLNLLGLVGLVIGGTLPYFAATVGRARIASHATQHHLLGCVLWQVLAVGTVVVGLATGTTWAATCGLVAYVVGIAAVLWMLPVPTRRQLRWAGPRVVALWAGCLWWAVAIVATAVEVHRSEVPTTGSRWLLVLVVGGYAQILWGSLAYLIPMLRRGGHEQLSRGFAATRSWEGLAAANLSAAAIVLDLTTLAAVAVGAWVLDTAVRVLRVELGDRAASMKGEPS